MLVGAGMADGYLNKPRLPDHLPFYLDAFWVLCSDRPAMGGSIPFSAICRFADRYDIAGTDFFDRFKALIRTLDNVFIEISRTDAAARASLKEGPKK